MNIVRTAREALDLTGDWRRNGETIGLVATMGALHEGHLALVRSARAANDRVVVSIFVNPTQFSPTEDLARYPRPFEDDCALLQSIGCDAVFAPSAQQMYQTGEGGADAAGHNQRPTHSATTWVEVALLGEIWEGAVRPGHLRGVATVVSKLFNIIQPHRAYFGEKDYQQLKVIEKLVNDLFFAIDIVPCRTVRESDGLALSSRNAYLSVDEREAAVALWQGLCAGAQLAQTGECDAAKIGIAVQKVCETEPLIALQYIAVVHAETLAPLAKLGGQPARLLIAARVGHTRLIDNIAL